MEAIENNELPPELQPSAGGPVIGGVPIENVSLSGTDADLRSDDDEPPASMDSL